MGEVCLRTVQGTKIEAKQYSTVWICMSGLTVAADLVR